MFGFVGSDDNNPTSDVSGAIRGSAIALIVIMTFVVCLRFYTRWLIRQPYRFDDWTILAALLPSLGVCITNIVREFSPASGSQFGNQWQEQKLNMVSLAVMS